LILFSILPLTRGYVHLFENTLKQDHQTQIFNESMNFSLGYTIGKKKTRRNATK